MLKKVFLVAAVTLLVGLSLYSSVQGAPGTEIYADGGFYWSQSGSGWNYHENAGWCYLYGGDWCQPKRFRWTYNVTYYATNFGTWDNIDYDYTYGMVNAFIPSTDATALARYLVTYNVAGQYFCYINQYYQYNAWCLCYAGSGSPYLLGIRNTHLTDYSPYGNPGTTKVAFDEIKIEY
jgi:hypothetical protein